MLLRIRHNPLLSVHGHIPRLAPIRGTARKAKAARAQLHGCFSGAREEKKRKKRVEKRSCTRNNERRGRFGRGIRREPHQHIHRQASDAVFGGVRPNPGRRRGIGEGYVFGRVEPPQPPTSTSSPLSPPPPAPVRARSCHRPIQPAVTAGGAICPPHPDPIAQMPSPRSRTRH